MINKKIKDVIFVFIDVETTGLHPRYGDKICEIGMIKTKNNKNLAFYESLINPHRQISPGAFRVNKITYKMVKGAPSFLEIAYDILKFIDGCVIVCHNASFDLGFIGTQLSELRIPLPDVIVIDTLILARKYYKFPSNTLDSIANILELEPPSHRALSDAMTTKEIFHIFVNDLKITTLNKLLKLQGGIFSFPSYDEIILPPQIEEVIKSNKVLKIKYISLEGEETERIIKPKDIVAYKDYIYLIAHCYLRNDKRTFRLDRIVDMEVLNTQKQN